MSLHQKYTWHDFLRENPDKIEKKTLKRTSSEGRKAFEAAYKKFIKGYLKERLEKLTKEREAVKGSNAYSRRLEKMIEKTKSCKL